MTALQQIGFDLLIIIFGIFGLLIVNLEKEK